MSDLEIIIGKSMEIGKYETEIKEILIKRGALKELIKLLDKLAPGSKAAMICDANTYKAAGKIVESLFAGASRPLKICFITINTVM